MQGGPGTATKRTKLKEAYRWLPLRGSRDKSQRNRHQSKEKEQCIGNLSRTGPTVGNDDEGEIERRGDYQTSEGVDERVD